MVQRPDLVGQQFGSYRLLRFIGGGGFAEVYLGEHTHLGTQAAIKVLHTQLTHNDIDTFRTEARTIARLVHPHIIRVLDFNVEGFTPFLVMDYANGGTTRERYPRGTILPLTIVVSYLQQIADALQYAHNEKLIHRDIKPENILLDQHHRVLLSDFGIALVAQSSRYQSTQNVIGTAAYMSPEQIQGHPRPASDQYSLGVVAYEWLSGALPFEGSFTELCAQHMFAPPPPLCRKAPTVSPEVEHVVMTALAKDPKQRFPHMHAFATALQQAVGTGSAQGTVLTTPVQERHIPTIASPHPQIDSTLPASQPGQRQTTGTPLYPQTNNTTPTGQPGQRHITGISPYPQTNNTAAGRTSSGPPGNMKWSFRTGSVVTSSPTVANDMLYFGSGHGKLYALHTALVQQKWTFTTGGSVYSAPAVANGIVYFGSENHHLYALQAGSGQQIWSFPTSGSVYSSPAVANGMVYFGSEDHNLYALDAASGQQIWAFITGGIIYSSPTVANGIVYFGSNDRRLYALHASSSQKMWSFPTGGLVTSSPTVANGVVYFGSDDHQLYALRGSSGQIIWSFPTGDKVTSSPTVDNGIVYFGSDDGNLYALKASSGQKMWSFPTGNRVCTSPAVVNGIVYFGSNDHQLYALEASSGQKIWSFLTGDKVTSSPAVANGVVYVGSDDGKLYAIFT
jgi:eukaryotic-like serine/threonine-protein kinase